MKYQKKNSTLFAQKQSIWKCALKSPSLTTGACDVPTSKRSNLASQGNPRLLSSAICISPSLKYLAPYVSLLNSLLRLDCDLARPFTAKQFAAACQQHHIVGNIQFETLDVREDLKYPAGEPIFEISEVPHMALAHIKRLQRMCKHCKITANLGNR
ncbi:hypothetical protein NECAME_09387 [Necator americanus]|uniref:Uncharacterized protein n=1 Tax=Necator americanus TaxID=51031 RepID=W2TDI6_NECAM|nr:hypothetical protein NECAME_09387 [Necator americanus]ETN80115.1 hypothetical protein NECAME_09387 [Necator americanus]